MNPVRSYEYLRLSRARLFDWIRPLSQEDYTREFPFGLQTVRATITEIARGEWAFARRLREEPLPPWEEWPFREERLPPTVFRLMPIPSRCNCAAIFRAP